MMHNIVTITLNPAIDKSSSVALLEPDKKMSCTAPVFEPGGGGINVARTVKRFGFETLAMFFCGGRNGQFLKHLLQNENVDTLPVDISGDTRENFTVMEVASSRQYRFGMPGPVISDWETEKLINQLKAIKNPKFIVISGSVATGIDDKFFAQIATIAESKKAKLIADMPGKALGSVVKNGVYMIKPNMGELAWLAGKKIITRDEAFVFCRDLIDKGHIEIAVVSMGREGAMLINREMADYIAAPQVEIKSTVGAGDSMVGGIIAGLLKNFSIAQAVRYGVASGSAATLNPGTQLCKPEDVDELYLKHFKNQVLT